MSRKSCQVLVLLSAHFFAACDSKFATSCTYPESPDCALLQEAAGDKSPSTDTSIGPDSDDSDDSYLTALPTGLSNATSFRINLSGMEIRGYRFKYGSAQSLDCSLDDGYSKKTSVANLLEMDVSEMPDGNLAVCLMTMDQEGNWLPLDQVLPVSWEKDTAAPMAVLSGFPSGISSATDVDLPVGGTGGVQFFKFKVGLAAATDCSSTSGYSAKTSASSNLEANLSAIADGEIKVCVVAEDLAGNWQSYADAASASWTKDTSAPTATVSGGPSSSSNVLSYSLTVSGADVSAYQSKFGPASTTDCSVMTGYTSAVSSSTPLSVDVTSLADGATRICILAVDSGGNTQPAASATVVNWIKDTVAPSSPSLSGAPGSSNNTASLNVSVSGTGVDYYRYKIVATSATCGTTSSGYIGPVLVSLPVTDSISGGSYPDGNYTLCVVSGDSAGNWQSYASPATVSWTRDTVAPTATISGAPTGTANPSNLVVTIGGSGVTHFKYQIGTSSADCAVSGGYGAEAAVADGITEALGTYADGPLVLCVIGRDAAGNWQATASEASWTKGTQIGPVAVLSNYPTGTSAATALNATVSGSGVTHYKFKVGITSATDCSSASGYGAQTAVANPLVSNLASSTIGQNLTLCVIGYDGTSWQSPATSVSWDRVAPTVWPAVLTGAPSVSSPATSLNVSVGGSGVTHYKFKTGVSSATDCSAPADYSASTAISSPITASLSAIAIGSEAKLCVIGSDGSNWQNESDATFTTWTRTCSAGYYPVSGSCVTVGTGYYSADGLNRQTCSNVPANASYSGPGTSSSCPWSCNTNYLLNSGGTGCDYRPNTQSVSCSSGQVVVGAIGRSGGWMDKLGVRCRAFSSGAFSGNITDGPEYGGSGGSAFTFDCPSGSYLYRITGGNGTSVSSPGSTYLANIIFHCRNLSNGTVTAVSSQYGSTAGVTNFDYSCGGAKPVSSIPFDSAGAYVGNVLQAYCGSDLDNTSMVFSPPSPPASDLVAHWHFDNNLEDESSNYPGTLQGAATYTPYVKRYGTAALELNGTDAWVSTNLDLSNRSAFTVAGLVYVKQTGSRVGFFGQNDLLEMGLGSSTNSTKACLWVNGSSEICDSTAFPLNTWVHVAVTSDSAGGGSTKLYINGVLKGTNSALTSTSNSYRFNIGHGVWDPASDTTKPYLKGHVDEIAVWGRALSATEVSGLVSGGSVTLNGTSQYLSVAASSDFAVGTGDFTVEWMQKMQPGVLFARAFSIGTYPNAAIAVSIENGANLYFWANSGYRLYASVTNLDSWNHFAITRSGTTVRAFQNGTQIGSITYSGDINNSSSALMIGSEGTANTYLNGQITNFHWVKGVAKYTSDFSKPSAPFPALSDSKLLLRFLDPASPFLDYSGLGKSVSNVNSSTFSAESPF